MFTPPPFLGSPFTVEFFDSAISARFTGGAPPSGRVTLPVGIQSGDVCVCQTRYRHSSNVTDDYFPSFTKIGSEVQTGGSHRDSMSYKILDGSETILIPPKAYSIALHSICAIFRGVQKPITSVTVGGYLGSVVTTNPSPQIQTISAITKPVVVIGTYTASQAGRTIDPRTMTPNKTGEILNGWSTDQDGDATPEANSMWMAYALYNSDPQNTTVDMDNEVTSLFNSLMSCHLILE